MEQEKWKDVGFVRRVKSDSHPSGNDGEEEGAGGGREAGHRLDPRTFGGQGRAETRRRREAPHAGPLARAPGGGRGVD